VITASIVVTDPPRSDLDTFYHCMKESSVKPQLYVVNNSLKDLDHPVVHKFAFKYIRNGRNLGYGSAHNVALRMILDNSDFHFVLNTDIQFGPDEFEKMIAFMQQNPDIGQLMPKIIYEDGSLQYLCKLLPTPTDLFARRFAPGPMKSLLRRRMEHFELRFSGYNRIMDIPYLSGCFMLFRVPALRRVGLFDERYFMYPEDIDITRRMHAEYRTVFFPGATVVHAHARSSYKTGKYLWRHALNTVRYFNKWGWFHDPERVRVNRETLRQFEQ
jgi:GT2 family glycosyltransferase